MSPLAIPDDHPSNRDRAAELSYLILTKHSLRRSSSERTCESMTVCNAVVPLLENSRGNLFVQILLPITDCHLSGLLGLRRRLDVRCYAGVGR